MHRKTKLSRRDKGLSCPQAVSSTRELEETNLPIEESIWIEHHIWLFPL